MAKNLKRSELARVLDMSNASITMAVNNGTLIPNDDKTIDIDKPVNKIWIDRQIAKGRTFDMNRLFKSEKKQPAQKKQPKSIKKQPEKEENQTEDDKSIAELREIELKIKKANLLKLQKSNQLSELEINKREGKLIPFDAAKTLTIFTIESLTKGYEQEVDTITDLMLSRFTSDRTEFTEVKKDIFEKYKEIKSNVIKKLLDDLDTVIKEYIEIRARGEKM